MSIKNTKSSVDPSTINFKKIEPPNSPKRKEGRFTVKLHVAESVDQMIKMVVPKGISIKIHGNPVHKGKLVGGSLVNISCNNVTPNAFEQREYNELLDYINKNHKVIRDNPYELKGLESAETPQVKIETEITNDEIAQRAFNFYERDGKVYGQL